MSSIGAPLLALLAPFVSYWKPSTKLDRSKAKRRSALLGSKIQLERTKRT